MVFLLVLDTFGRKALFSLPELVVGHDAPKSDVAVADAPEDGAELHGRLGLTENSDKAPILHLLHHGPAVGGGRAEGLQGLPVLLKRACAPDRFKREGQKPELQELLLLGTLPSCGKLEVMEPFRRQHHVTIQVWVLDSMLRIVQDSRFLFPFLKRLRVDFHEYLDY